MFCPVGVLDTKQPYAEHHHPSDRADCGGAGWRVQALPASAYPTHVACLHAWQQHRAQCYHQGECNVMHFRWLNHQSCCEVISLDLAKVAYEYVIIFHELKSTICDWCVHWRLLKLAEERAAEEKLLLLLLFSNAAKGLFSSKTYFFVFMIRWETKCFSLHTAKFSIMCVNMTCECTCNLYHQNNYSLSL